MSTFLIVILYNIYIFLLIPIILPFFGSAEQFINIKIVFMKGYTYDKSLSEKESQILSFVYSGNEHYLNAFNFVHKFYRINYRLHKSNHLAVFKTVYIKKVKTARMEACEQLQYCAKHPFQIEKRNSGMFSRLFRRRTKYVKRNSRYNGLILWTQKKRLFTL